MNENVLEMEHITEKESTIPSEISTTLTTHDEIVGYDHCGWPLYPLRIISLLRAMGMSDDIID